MKLQCFVYSQTQSYEIEIGHHILEEQMKLFPSRCAMITDENVATLYGKKLLSILHPASKLFSFPVGEMHKTRATKEHLENQLFTDGFGRDTLLIALGGGIVMDMAGYLAATFCRGIPLYLIPTTLLAMVDASIGGKNGVNLPFGKNMVGTIYQPKKVIIDLTTLRSLPQREKKQGWVEMIKHGLIADEEFFFYLKANVGALEGEKLEKAIYESCRIKIAVVEKDEKESGLRQILNFGHTIGHAIELTTEHQLLHGEAVALGILAESYLAMHLGILSSESFEEIKQIFHALQLSLPRALSFEKMKTTMKIDKKSVKGEIYCVLLEKIGKVYTSDGRYSFCVPDPLLNEAVEWLNRCYVL